MLSLFPQLLFLGPFAPFLLRLALAFTFFNTAWAQFRNRNSLAQAFTVVECAIAGMFLVGIFTQIAAIIAVALAVMWLVAPAKAHGHYSSKNTALLILIISLSLIVSGAGALAFDLPL